MSTKKKKTRNKENEPLSSNDPELNGSLKLSREEKIQLEVLQQSKVKTFRLNLQKEENEEMKQWYRMICKQSNISIGSIPAWMLDLFDENIVIWNED